MTILRRLLTLSLFCALITVTALLAMAGQVPASASPFHPAQMTDNPTWGLDIRINPPNQMGFDAQRNHTLAVDPTNPNNAIAGYDNYVFGGGQAALSNSTDGGRTWQGGRLPLLGQEEMVPLYSAGVAYDAAGTIYTVAAAITSTQQGVYVVTATNGLLSPARPIAVTDFYEYRNQPNMAVDPRPGARNVYTFWLFTDNVGSYFHGIQGRYSHDGGMTWSSDVQVSDVGNDISYGPSSAVASDGTVYLASSRQDTFIPGEGDFRLFLDRSTDRGITWGQDRLITGAPITKMGIPDWKGRELTLRGSEKCSLIRIFHYPYIVVAPNDPNTVYAVWNDGRWDAAFNECTGPGKHSDIAFSRTTDAGLTWSAPIRVNDDPMGNGIDQFHPGIGLRADGVIGVTWYDRRYDAANPYWYNLAYSQSTDGGLTWSANTRVSDTSSNPDSVQDVKLIDELGFRKNVAFGPDYVLPAWHNTEPSVSRGDLFTDRGILPPNSTATPTLATTSTRTSTSTSIPPTGTRTATGTTGISTATATTQASSTATSTSAATSIATTTAVATTVATATPCTTSFSDVDMNNTFYVFIRCLACRGIISGYADGTFKPNNLVTRGQLAKIVSNAANFTEDPNPQMFEDVPPSNTFYQWINRLARRGHMSGYPCGGVGEPCTTGMPYFRPFANATRGQISKIVSNAAGYTEIPTDQTFEDVSSTHTFYNEIQRLATRNIMQGYSCGGVGEPCLSGKPYFRPGNNVTRGQSAKIVASAFYPDCETP